MIRTVTAIFSKEHLHIANHFDQREQTQRLHLPIHAPLWFSGHASLKKQTEWIVFQKLAQNKKVGPVSRPHGV
jgi:hypothetical protein